MFLRNKYIAAGALNEVGIGTWETKIERERESEGMDEGKRKKKKQLHNLTMLLCGALDEEKKIH